MKSLIDDIKLFHNPVPKESLMKKVTLDKYIDNLYNKSGVKPSTFLFRVPLHSHHPSED
jgi:hypothetical protein